MFNRKEQVALMLLCGALLAGSGLATVDYYYPPVLEEFRVVPAAVEKPLSSEPVDVEPGEEPVLLAVDLNTATAAQLQQLPAIGAKTAERILAYRREKGRFTDVEALGEVKGIGPRTLEKLRPLVRVSTGKAGGDRRILPQNSGK